MDRIHELWRWLLGVVESLFMSDWGVIPWLDRVYAALEILAPYVRLFDYVVDMRFFLGAIFLYLMIESGLMIMRFLRFAAVLKR